MEKNFLIKLANIANDLDNLGLFVEADELTKVLRLSAKDADDDNMADKILKLLAKEDVSCPECGGKMDMENGLCNCGDEDCDCTIDMKDEIDDFLHRIGIGNVDCPECNSTLELKGSHCVCKNGDCKCKQKVAKTLLSELFDNKKFDRKFSNSRTASYEDHEFSMARKQLMAAHEAIEKILDKLGNDEGNIMAWTQAYITMASDYLQSVENYFVYGENHDELNDDSDEDETSSFAFDSDDSEDMTGKAYLDSDNYITTLGEIEASPNANEIISSAYDWATDVLANDMDSDEVREYLPNNKTLFSFIDKHFEGGIPAFMKSMNFPSRNRMASKENKGKRLNKPFRTPGGPKKFSVYVKNKKGNIIKVNFGDPKLSIKRDDPNRRKNFRARHNCDTDPRAKDRTTAKYWSCKFWSNPSVSSLLKGK